MVLDDILLILKNDPELKTLINGVYAFGIGTNKIPCLVYEYTELTSDKVKAQSRLTLTITNSNSEYAKNLQIHKKVKQLLLTLGDENLNNDITEVALNGGGILLNDETQTIHNKAIFIIKYKERK